MEQIVQSFNDYLVSEGKAISTIKHAVTYVRRFIHKSNVTDLSEVTTQVITDYFAQLEVCSQAKSNLIISTLRSFFRWANVSGLDFPKQRHVLTKNVHPLSEKDMEAIEYWIYMNTVEPIYVRRYVLRLIFYTGLRVKDIMKLRRVDFELTDESGEAQSTLEITKEGLRRKVSIPRDLKESLQNYFNCYWQDKNALNVTIGNMNHMCKYLNQNNILGDGRRIYPELFRASFACHCLTKGVSLKDLQQLMGHKSIRTTRGYLKMMSQKRKEEIKNEHTK